MFWKQGCVLDYDPSAMSMLLFMPWCRIDRRYTVDRLQILPLDHLQEIEGLHDADQVRVKAVMAMYKTIEGRPVDKAAIVRYDDRSPIDELPQDDIENVFELASLACFSGLALRNYFDPLGPYCNSDCFILYGQRFETTEFAALTTRRREGKHMSVWSVDRLWITVPIHCQLVREVKLDNSLLVALPKQRAEDPVTWVRWQNAISCFNQANTDGESVRFQVEWVLLVSAFQHLMNAESKAKDVAVKFSESVVPSEELLVRDAARRSKDWTDDGKSIRYEWMREFYRIRGDFAHGKLDLSQPAVWNPIEHLVLASIAFPLLVRSLLRNSGHYELTEEDQIQIDSFEAFANTADFLNPPPGQQNSLETHWGRIRMDWSRRWTAQRAVEHWRSLRTDSPQDDDAQ